MVQTLLKALLAAIFAGMVTALVVAGLMNAAVLPSSAMLMVFIVVAVAVLIGAAVMLFAAARSHDRLVLERGPEMSTLIMPAAPRVERSRLQRAK